MGGELNQEGEAMADPTDSSFCPQWPDRCCFCLIKRYGVMFTSLFSILSDFFFISCFSYLIYDPMEWNKGYNRLENWVVSTHWDTDITQGALHVMTQINVHKDLLLYICITVSGIHAICGLLLALGTCMKPSVKQRLLFLPWLTLDMFFIVLTTAIFISWAFLSFFVHILVAIFFPVVSGALLGLWIYMWRNVREYFIVCGQLDDIDLAKARANQSAAMYRKLPPATSSSQSPTEMRSSNNHQPNYQHRHLMHHQVPVWMKNKQ